MKILILLSLILPGIVQAQIFRCEAKGETYFSQIPCADNSEAVVIEDHPMFSEAALEVEAEADEQLIPVEPKKTQAENMQEFVSTLHRQRTEQLQQIDREIGTLAAQLDVIGDAPSDVEKRKSTAEQLTGLQTSRISILEQYESMIMEAERRVAALSGQNGAADDRIN